MSITQDIKTALAGPLDRSVVATREQGGKVLSYVEAWHCIAEANRIFGFDGWNRETESMDLVQAEQVEGKWRIGYVSRVKIESLGVVRHGTGFGQGIDKDQGRAHESAAKEAESDAMKRALMTFGNPFGLALYDKTQSMVEDVPPPVDPAVEIKRWLGKDGIGLSKSDFEAFQSLLAGTPAGWLTVAQAAKNNEVTNYEELVQFVAGLKLTKKENA